MKEPRSGQNVVMAAATTAAALSPAAVVTPAGAVPAVVTPVTVMPRIYLAGPEVFLPQPLLVAGQKKHVCRQYGLEGVFPLDASLDLEGVPPQEAGRQIAAANEDLMRSCQALIANMSPFRGPAMDGGTAWEMGFMRGLGRPVFAYTTSASLFAPRVLASLRSPARLRADGSGIEDGDGMLVEDFGLADNLMMAASWQGPDAPPTGACCHPDPLKAFALAVQAAALALGTVEPDVQS